MIKKSAVFFIFVFMLAVPVFQASAQGPEMQEKPGLRTGSPAPDFTAETHEGKTVTLSELYAKGPVVLVFYRGAWCPYCNVHLRQFQAKSAEIKAAGAQIVAVSVDLKEYANQTVQENELDFEVISDPNAGILAAYNLLYNVPAELNEKYKSEYHIDLEKHSGRSDGLLAVPATYVINSKGVIVFGYANEDYKMRTHPDEVLQVLESGIAS